MIVLGLDLSTHVGYAILDNECLARSGTFHAPDAAPTNLNPRISGDHKFLNEAKQIAEFIRTELLSYGKIDKIIIEQTNQGRSRTVQKSLEFIHYAVLDMLLKEDLLKNTYYFDSSEWRSKLQIKKSKEQRVHNKNVKLKKARGKIGWKHLSVAWANQTFSLNLILKDNDQADAIALTQMHRFIIEPTYPNLSQIFT